MLTHSFVHSASDAIPAFCFIVSCEPIFAHWLSIMLPVNVRAFAAPKLTLGIMSSAPAINVIVVFFILYFSFIYGMDFEIRKSLYGKVLRKHFLDPRVQ